MELFISRSWPLKHFSDPSVWQRLQEIDHVHLMMEVYRQIKCHHIVLDKQIQVQVHQILQFLEVQFATQMVVQLNNYSLLFTKNQKQVPIY